MRGAGVGSGETAAFPRGLCVAVGHDMTIAKTPLALMLVVAAFACQTRAIGASGDDQENLLQSTKDGGPRGEGTDGHDGDDEDEDEDGEGPAGETASSPGCMDVMDDLSSAAALQERVTFFASKENGGRAPGTPGDIAVRRHVEDFFRCLGLEPGANGGKFQQAFTNSDQASTANVIGVLRGTDPTVNKEVIVIGAHHDHFGALGDQGVRLGANDNASGLAGLLASASALKKRGGLRRTIMFIAFGAEETSEAPPWVEGSHFFVTHLPDGLSLDDIVHVTTMDMIGTYSDTTNLDAMGAANGTPGRAALQEARSLSPNIKISMDADAEEGDSDFDPFCRRGVPYVGFYTEDSRCYHKACDTADRLDYANMSAIVKIVIEMNAKLASTTTNLVEAKRRVSDPCRFR